jgi:hypothetical protein
MRECKQSVARRRGLGGGGGSINTNLLMYYVSVIEKVGGHEDRERERG